MHFRTVARDCLYLNWALPRSSAPALPAPLRYEVHGGENGEEWIFASALLFRLSGLHPPDLPFLRLSYPQMNLRLYVVDGDGVPSVLFVRMLVPRWVAPVSRILARQPAAAATFEYPSPSQGPQEGEWRWILEERVGRFLRPVSRRLEIRARLGMPTFGPGPRLGSWERTVDYFQHRRRGSVFRERGVMCDQRGGTYRT